MLSTACFRSTAVPSFHTLTLKGPASGLGLHSFAYRAVTSSAARRSTDQYTESAEAQPPAEPNRSAKPRQRRSQQNPPLTVLPPETAVASSSADGESSTAPAPTARRRVTQRKASAAAAVEASTEEPQEVAASTAMPAAAAESTSSSLQMPETPARSRRKAATRRPTQGTQSDVTSRIPPEPLEDPMAGIPRELHDNHPLPTTTTADLSMESLASPSAATPVSPAQPPGTTAAEPSSPAAVIKGCNLGVRGVGVGDAVHGVVAAVREGYVIVELPALGRGVTAVLEAADLGAAGMSAAELRSRVPIDSEIKAIVSSATGPTLLLSQPQLTPQAGTTTRPPPIATSTPVVVMPEAVPPEPSAQPAEAAAPKRKLKIRARGSLFGRRPSESKQQEEEDSGWGGRSAPAAASPGSSLQGVLAVAAESPEESAATTSGVAADIGRCVTWSDLRHVVDSQTQLMDEAGLGALTRRLTRMLAAEAQKPPPKDGGPSMAAEDKAAAEQVLQAWAKHATAHVPGCVTSKLAAHMAPVVVAGGLRLLENRTDTAQKVGDFMRRALPAAKESGELRSLGTADLTTVLRAAAEALAGKVDSDMLTELELASYARIDSFGSEQLAEVAEALEKLGKSKKWAPNQVWLDRFIELTRPKLLALSPRALASSFKAMAGFNFRPPQDWLDRWQQAFQMRMREMAPMDLSNALMAMAKLGVGFGAEKDGGSKGGAARGPGGLMDMDMPMPDFDDMLDMDDFDMDMEPPGLAGLGGPGGFDMDNLDFGSGGAGRVDSAGQDIGSFKLADEDIGSVPDMTDEDFDPFLDEPVGPPADRGSEKSAAMMAQAKDMNTGSERRDKKQ